MSSALLDALRFARAWIRPRADLRVRERWVEPEEGGAPVPATFIAGTRIRPGASADPGWVLLHGVTRPGRSHPGLLRFARAVASTGARVLIPEIPEWTEMRFAPERAQSIIRGAVSHLARDPESPPGGVMLVGFSFGAPQALLVGADPAQRPHVKGVVGWGGYADLHRTVTFQFTGEHRWGGTPYRQRPDPYGRWVVGANCLPLSGEIDGAHEVTEALRALAMHAGELGVMAWDPSLGRMKRHLRRGLPPRARPLYDLFVPPGESAPDRTRALELIDRVVPVAKTRIPLLDPLPLIEGVRVPVRLLHSRSDHLIPFTETLALAETLSRRAPDLDHGITGLFEHSGGAGAGGIVARSREGLRFLGNLAGVFAVSRAEGPVGSRSG